MAWHDMPWARRGEAWRGVERHGVAWRGVAWHGMARHDMGNTALTMFMFAFPKRPVSWYLALGWELHRNSASPCLHRASASSRLVPCCQFASMGMPRTGKPSNSCQGMPACLLQLSHWVPLLGNRGVGVIDRDADPDLEILQASNGRRVQNIPMQCMYMGDVACHGRPGA